MVARKKKGVAAETSPTPGQIPGADATASVSVSEGQPVISSPVVVSDPNDGGDSAPAVDRPVGITLKNDGPISRFEPLTKTIIPAGAVIRIDTGDADQVRKNIAQINSLARRKVLVEVEDQ